MPLFDQNDFFSELESLKNIIVFFNFRRKDLFKKQPK